MAARLGYFGWLVVCGDIGTVIAQACGRLRVLGAVLELIKLIGSLSKLVNADYIEAMRWNELREQACPVARGLSVIGDRWTLLILRDCFQGVRRFDQFQHRLGVTRHLLTDRLRKLEDAGVLQRVQYQERPQRHEYRLTDAGRELYPVLVSLIEWANTHVPSDAPTQFRLVARDSGRPIKPLLIDENTGKPILAHEVEAEMASQK